MEIKGEGAGKTEKSMGGERRGRRNCCPNQSGRRAGGKYKSKQRVCLLFPEEGQEAYLAVWKEVVKVNNPPPPPKPQASKFLTWDEKGGC